MSLIDLSSNVSSWHGADIPAGRPAEMVLTGGMEALAIGLVAGFGMMLHWFTTTPAPLWSAALAGKSIFEIWPWIGPWLQFETAALLVAAAGWRACMRPVAGRTAQPANVSVRK